MRLVAFKRFLDLELLLRPLTVLTGLNGSGKSTVVQAILLAHQASLTRASHVALHAWPGLDLGFSSDVLNVDAEDDLIGVSLTSNSVAFEWTFSAGATAEPRSYLHVRSQPDVAPEPIGNTGSPFTYLSAERLGPRTSHPSAPGSAEELTPGEDGRFVAQILATAGRSEVSNRRLCPAAPAITTLQAQTEAWLSELVGTTQIEADLVPRTSIATMRIRTPGRMGEWMLPTNTGFGLSYALPVVVAGLFTPRNGLLIVDSPEAHLHPSAQSALGVFLATVASDGVQVVVETHSDHVLNGIRKAVAGGHILDAASVIVTFFGEGQPASLDVDHRGGISAWPDGFFDQIEADLQQLVRERPR